MLGIIDYEGEVVYSAKYDHIFKALFTSDDKTLLASFLSSVLGLEITADGVTVLNAELPPGNEKDKRVRLDIRARLADGSVINIEMQASDEGNMGKRSLYNLSRLMGGQLKSGKDKNYERLCPTIAINVLDFDYLKTQDKYITRFRMKETENNIEMRDAEYFEIIFIELPKLPKDAGNSMIELWVKFFSAETEEDLKMVATQEPIFKTAVKRLREVSASEERRYLADMRHKDMLDRNTARFVSRREGRAEGLAEGLTEGLAEGLAEAKAEIARNMKAEGYGNEEIAKITKLTVTQIEQI